MRETCEAAPCPPGVLATDREMLARGRGPIAAGFRPTAHDAYSVDNLTGKKAADGAMTLKFGGDDDRFQPPGDRYGLHVRL